MTQTMEGLDEEDAEEPRVYWFSLRDPPELPVDDGEVTDASLQAMEWGKPGKWVTQWALRMHKRTRIEA